MNPFSSVSSQYSFARSALYRSAAASSQYARPAGAAPGLTSAQAATPVFSTAKPLDYTVCIQSKTATGQPGRDYLPGHASLVVYANDPSRLMSNPTAQTFGMWPSRSGGWLGRLIDSFLPQSDRTDVRVNDPGDTPSSSVYPFRHCQPISPDGYRQLVDYAGKAGDYQLRTNNCADFAQTGFNTATQSCSFGTYGFSAAPSDAGAQIIEKSGGTRAEPNLLASGWNTVKSGLSGLGDRLGDTWSRATNSVSRSLGGAWSSVVSLWPW